MSYEVIEGEWNWFVS